MNFELFENINYEYVFNLYKLALSNPTNLSDIKQTYSRDNKFLQENLNFLINIDIFKINGNIVSIHHNDNLEFKELILLSISKEPNYAVSVKNYLVNFSKNSEGTYIFKPDKYYNNKSSDLRNFLISMNYLKNEKDAYILLDNSILSIFKKIEFSPEQLKKRIRDQELIGKEAENLIFEHEVEKLKDYGNDFKPDHIALRDVSAGYDILSYDISDKSNPKKIFIEVKAVSQSNYKFYLSLLEHQTANKYNESYYIYLLPVDFSKKSKFNLDKLLKINNIISNIIENDKSWEISNDGYVISKI